MSTFLIKDYVVSRKRIGKGSFSTIYKAFNTKNNNEYAIKEIIIDKKSIKSNVKREFLVLKKLDHPNIVKLHDLIIDTNYNNIYFVFDYFKNGDLANFLDSKPLKEKYCKKYSKQLADGLKYLVENDILHRDLKPQNILLTNDYNIKIADFGFARKVDKDMLLNTLCGSPMYMAPEIINKQDYSIKSDLWSVGIIIYQMIYGKVPFDVSNFMQLIKKVNSEKINYSEDNIKISNECLNLIESLLQVNVEKRISWDNFFYHPWFTVNDLLNEENNLLDFSISNNKSLPKLNNFNHHLEENQFASFVHKSIKLKESKEIKPKNDSKIINDNTDDLEINFLESLSESCEYQSCDTDNEDTDIDLDLSNDSDENILKPHEHQYNTRSKSKNKDKEQYTEISTEAAKPIKIPKNKRIREVEHEYELIDKNNLEFNPQSAPTRTKTLSESFKEYLFSSLKQSYKYITNNKSI